MVLILWELRNCISVVLCSYLIPSYQIYRLEQRTGTYGSRVTCGSLAHRQNLAGISLQHGKTANTSSKAFQSYNWCHVQFSHSLIGQVSVGLEDVVVPCDTNAYMHSSHWKPFLKMRLPWLSLSLSQKSSRPCYSHVASWKWQNTKRLW